MSDFTLHARNVRCVAKIFCAPSIILKILDPPLLIILPGADPGFSFRGGGGAKDYIRERTLLARNPKSLSAGIQGPLKSPGSSRFFLMRSSAL